MAWHCKDTGSYDRTSTEAIENATEIYGILNSCGWTLNAVTGVLGNIGAESGYNPWRWQSDNVGSSGGSPWTNQGYGLVQFTPASKYIDDANAQAMAGYGPNFSNQTGSTLDGQAQMLYVDGYADYYSTDSYPLSYADFKVSIQTPAYLTAAWMYNYERPRSYDTLAGRQEAAEYWYETLSGVTPPTPGGGGGRSGKLIYYLKPRWKMYRRR